MFFLEKPQFCQLPEAPSSYMANPKKIDLNLVRLNYKVWLSDNDDQGILGDGKWQILKAIEECGSLTAACKKLNLTYRRTWGDLKKIEQRLGFPLLEKSRGGTEGGASQLSPRGKKLVNAFDAFHQSTDGTIQQAFVVLKEDLTNLSK
jgi:molybdate transport system regulatory protein